MPPTRITSPRQLLVLPLIALLAPAAEARALTSGSPAADGAYRFVARIKVGEQFGCTGVLVHPRVLVTAKSCFAEAGRAAKAGPPPRPTTVVFEPTSPGQASTSLAVRTVIPHPDRNVAAVLLNARVEGITPVTMGAAPSVGEVLQLAGYGRTESAWFPDRLQTTTFKVQSIKGGLLEVVGSEAASATTCKGDAGGPALRERSGRLELVAMHHTSWQQGCLDSGEQRQGTTETRLDDLTDWLRGVGGEAVPTGRLCVPGTFIMCPGDFDGDGRSDIVTLSRSGTGWNERASVDLSNGSGFSTSRWGMGTAVHMRNGGAADYRVLTGDFNGDGKADLATVSPNGGGAWRDWVAMEISNGKGFESTVWRAGTPIHMRNGGVADYRVLAGDFNGDGKTDLATVSPNGGGAWRDWVAMELSNGKGFESTVWGAGTPIHMRNGGAADYRVLAGDFNGDGKTDLATITPNAGGGWSENVAVELSKGTGFDSVVWKASTSGHMRNGGAADYRVLAADFNGDGKTDLATITPNAGGGWRDWVAMELSNGSGFDSVVWPASTPGHMRNGGAGNYQVAAVDLNADDRADLVTFTQDAAGGWAEWMSIELSTGSGFSSLTWTTPTPQHARNGASNRRYPMLPGDYDGDGRADVAILSPDGGGAWDAWMTVDLSTGSAFNAQTWTSPTPKSMRSGMP